MSLCCIHVGYISQDSYSEPVNKTEKNKKLERASQTNVHHSRVYPKLLIALIDIKSEKLVFVFLAKGGKKQNTFICLVQQNLIEQKVERERE